MTTVVYGMVRYLLRSIAEGVFGIDKQSETDCKVLRLLRSNCHDVRHPKNEYHVQDIE